MAPRSGDKRLLGSAASARLLLALAATAALTLTGCGGGSDSTAAPGEGSTAAGSTGEAAGKDSQDSSAPRHTAGAKHPAGGEKAAGEKPSAKQGPRIVPPKGPREPAITAAQRKQATVADISLQSPMLGGGSQGPGLLPSAYGCAGANLWPTLRWSAPPSDTRELVLFAMNVQPVAEKIFFDWAVAGLDPGLREIKSGKLPAGAVLGRNSFGQAGYSLCPSGQAETYLFALYAVPKRLSVKRGFDPRALRKEVSGLSGNAGLLAAVYARE